MKVREVNFDGLIGPTHGYAALALGNLASMQHKGWISSPKQAALQGLKKMKQVMDLGIPQGFFLPQERPLFSRMRELGFVGSDKAILKKIARTAPELLYSLSSSSSMWAANSATVTPSQDSEDRKVHITVANLENRFHRSIEADATYRMLTLLFKNAEGIVIHPPLPPGGGLGDEGAANHTRFSSGVHLFVYGESIFEPKSATKHFPARQALEASQAIARQHRIHPKNVVFARQNPRLIDEGIFHNDLISVGHENMFLYHQRAFVDTERVIQELEKKCTLNLICVTDSMMTVDQARDTYFFNSQIVTDNFGHYVLIAPFECRSLNLEWLPINQIIYTDVEQSMFNGGGPACLRLRIMLNDHELKKVDSRFLLTEALYSELVAWVEDYYRDELTLNDLSDWKFVQEAYEALEALTHLLKLGHYYAFQRA